MNTCQRQSPKTFMVIIWSFQPLMPCQDLRFLLCGVEFTVNTENRIDVNVNWTGKFAIEFKNNGDEIITQLPLDFNFIF